MLFTRNAIKFYSLVQKICLFFQKETSHYEDSSVLDSRELKHYVFGDKFYLKNAGKLRFHVFLHFHPTKPIIL